MILRPLALVGRNRSSWTNVRPFSSRFRPATFVILFLIFPWSFLCLFSLPFHLFARSINTPGVIKRVSELFRGHVDLILGFNTFLPPGYKIEVNPSADNNGEMVTTIITPQGTLTTVSGGPLIGPGGQIISIVPNNRRPEGTYAAPALPVTYTAPSSSSSSGYMSASARPAMPSTTAVMPPPGAPPARMGPATTASSSSSSSTASASGGTGTGTGGTGAPPHSANMLEFDHAISYVTKIKKRFINEPQVSLATRRPPSCSLLFVTHVSSSFPCLHFPFRFFVCLFSQTYRAFLEILHTYQRQNRNIKEVLERVSVLFKDHPDLLRDFTYFLPDAVQEAAKERLQKAAEAARQKEATAKQQGESQAATSAAAGRQSGGPGSRGGAAGAGAGTRYAGAPSGRGGFDAGTGPSSTRGGGAGSGSGGGAAVMGRDRERLRDADAEAEREGTSRMQRERMMARDASENDRERDRLIDRQRDRMTVGMGPGKSPRMMQQARKRRGKEEELHLTLTPSERSFFVKLKSYLGSREAWVETLKCFDLYSSEVITRNELLALLSDIFGQDKSFLLDEVKILLTQRGALDFTPEDVWFSMPIGELAASKREQSSGAFPFLPFFRFSSLSLPSPSFSFSFSPSRFLSSCVLCVVLCLQAKSTFRRRRAARLRTARCRMATRSWPAASGEGSSGRSATTAGCRCPRAARTSASRSCARTSTRTRCSAARTRGSRWTWSSTATLPPSAPWSP